MSDKFSEQYMLYKAKNDGQGAASQWNLGSKRNCVFLEMARQDGKDSNNNARFDWDKKLIFKLGIADIGEILATLVGLQTGVGALDTQSGRYKGLYHSNEKGNAILRFDKNEGGRFHIRLSIKRGEAQDMIHHSISSGEACVLSVLLRRAIEVMYRWH